jgi:hypothetical protein
VNKLTLIIKKDWFLDEYGRTTLLRGINLGSSSKVPKIPNGATHIKTDFADHKEVSFIGRPFSLTKAPDHLKRLKHWGFNCIRFLITWEAIEHRGPNSYDLEYLEYLEELLKITSEYGFYIIIDPHQDAWSRISGGDGAPGWTFEKIGLDFTKFRETGAAYVMQYAYDETDPNSYSIMHWTNNYLRYANATMWTLFFGGNQFAPLIEVDGQKVQDFLQNHFFESFKKVASQIKGIPGILGFGPLNEPNQGWIGLKVDGSNYEGFSEVLGHAFTPFEAMITSAGYSRTIGYREIKRFGIRETRKDVINKKGETCWLDDFNDIWFELGIWDIDENKEPYINKNDYFLEKEGKVVNFYQDHLLPFIINYTKTIRKTFPEAIIFYEGPAENIMRGEAIDMPSVENLVNASHWYDVATLGTQKPMLKANFDIISNKPVIGKNNVQKMFNRQLALIKEYSMKFQGGIPTLIGEFGVPFNLNNKSSYQKWEAGDENAFEDQTRALTMYYNALDDNLLHSTQWNYTPDNSNKWGDLWNLEDLSIFSITQQINENDINSGGRAIQGFCRPHFIACSGIPLKMVFNFETKEFLFEFEADPSILEPSLIYIPEIQYSSGYVVDAPECKIKEVESNNQIIQIYAKSSGTKQVRINKK